MQRHVTSVFSQYQTIDNSSVNSKQLQYWLKQISNPTPPPTFGYQWTFMSNQSSNQQKRSTNLQVPIDNRHMYDQISFGKTVNSSIEKQRDKQNNSLMSNQSGVENRQVRESRSKSYVNAMLALQKKVRTLEDQNVFMRKNISKLNEQRNKSMTQSSANEEELKTKLKILQPKVVRIDELIQQNKSLRQAKQQKNRKIKLLQKNNKQLKQKYENLNQNNVQLQKHVQQLKSKYQEQIKKLSGQQQQIKSLYQKNKILQQMKQKSVTSLLQKYNKSVELIKQMQNQNVKLRNQVQHTKNKYNQQVKNLEQNHQNQVKKCQIQFQKLKQNIALKQSLIQEKKKQAQYFRDAYQKKDQQFVQLIKSQHQIKQMEQKILTSNINEQKTQTNRTKQAPIPKIKQLTKNDDSKKNNQEHQVQKLQKVQQNNNKIGNSIQSSMIQIPQTLIYGNKASFAGFESQKQDQQQEFDESVIPSVPVPFQTKSVGKPIQKKKKDRKGVLSSQSRKNQSKQNSKQKQVKKENIPINKIIKQQSLLSPHQQKRVSRKRNQDQNASFTMKSNQAPRTQPMHKIKIQEDFGSQPRQNKQSRIANSYFYTAQYPPLPHKHRNEQVHEFFCKGNTSHQSIDQVMIMELQKQLLQLYEQQQNLILASNDQFATQTYRSEYVGRLKQLNEQLRIKNQKICDLKSRI